MSDPVSSILSTARACAANFALFAALAAPQAGAPPPRAPAAGPFAELRAKSGTRLSVLQVKEAPKEALFAFVPTGLLDDSAGQTQMAHVLEHMLIRSTDKDGLSDGTLTFNGETNEVALRLEVIAPPEQTKAALTKVVGWLQATEFDAAALEAEKQKIAGELDTTCANGFTHKWAFAAWNQVARRGRKHAAVRGDVMAATAEQVESACDDRVEFAKVRIVAVGPLSADYIEHFAQGESALSADVGGLAGPLADAAAKRHAAVAAKRAKEVMPLASGDLAATWDLPNSHLLAWYLLPNESADDAAAALVLAQRIGAKLQTDAKLKAKQVVAIASSDAVVPEGRVLMLSASLPAGADSGAVLAAFDGALANPLAAAAPYGAIDDFLKMEAAELTRPPDFQVLRRQMAGRPGADLLEAQFALNLALRERAAGCSSGALGAAVSRLSKSTLETLVKERLVPAKRSTLTLTPKK